MPSQTPKPTLADVLKTAKAKAAEVSFAVENRGRISMAGAPLSSGGIPEIAKWCRDLTITVAALAEHMHALEAKIAMLESDEHVFDEASDDASDFVRPVDPTPE